MLFRCIEDRVAHFEESTGRFHLQKWRKGMGAQSMIVALASELTDNTGTHVRAGFPEILADLKDQHPNAEVMLFLRSQPGTYLRVAEVGSELLVERATPAEISVALEDGDAQVFKPVTGGYASDATDIGSNTGRGPGLSSLGS